MDLIIFDNLQPHRQCYPSSPPPWCCREMQSVPFIKKYILMSIDSVYIFVTCRLSFNLSHNYFIGSLKGKKEKTIYSNSLAGLFLDLFTFVLQVRLFWGEGAGTIWQVDKLDTDAVIMADIKQDELWVDLLFNGDGNTTKRIMEGLSYLHKNMNIVIVENRFMQQSVKSRSVLGNAISTVGKKSILAFWRQIHLKIQCQPHGTLQFSEIQYKSDRGRE